MNIFLTLLTILGGIVFVLLVLMLLAVAFLFTVCKLSLWQAERERKKQLFQKARNQSDDSLFR